MNKGIKEIVEHHHLQMYFKKKTHAKSTCRLGESNKEHWGQMIDIKIHETAVEAWTNKHGNKTILWKIITQWYPVEQPHENRGRRFESRRRNVGVEVGKYACGATATLQHITTECQRRDKQETTEDAQAESEKHIAQSHMPNTVKKVMSYMNKHTWNSIEEEKKGIEMGEQQTTPA